MKVKGFTKLTIQIAVLSVSMIGLSFLTDTKVWLDYFNTKVDGSLIGSLDSVYGLGCMKNECINNTTIHYHWNYRGYVYFITGLIFFIMSVIKIGLSHKEEDFKL
jgi:hypothetical protein